MKKQIKKVYIIGAGPGNPELMTIKAHRLLTKYAEVVVYDRLVPEEILKLIPKGIKRIYAGKSCRKHHMTQEEINNELVKQAKTGKKVVRLKGGDPFIFGRGGEEVEFLAKNTIDFEVVPGISSASGCSSSTNIPLTHRGISNGIYFITGHMQKGKPMKLNWKALADPKITIVVYMGLANLHKICVNLIKNGLPKTTAVAAIQEGTTIKERKIFGTLANISKKIEENDFQPPTLIIIGKVAQMGNNLGSSPSC